MWSAAAGAWGLWWVVSMAAPAPAAAGPAAPRPVCLATDYGLDDFYVGALKGAVLQKNPAASIHDLTHRLPSFDIQGGAFVLAQATAFLPAESVVVAVVDPGVGTARRPLALRTKRGITYVGPDNGLFTWVIREQGLAEARTLTRADAMLEGAQSSTFHGRDIFGPVAGWLTAPGHSFADLGPVVKDPVMFPIQDAERKDATVVGQVLLVDHYGNILTNIPRALYEGAQFADPTDANRKVVRARVGGHGGALFPVMQTYAQVKVGTEVAVVNSLGLMELALNQAHAGQKLGVHTGDRVELLPRP